jgi:hypothetical protein
MQAKALRQANGQALVLQQPRVVSSQQAEDLGKDKTLQGSNIIVHQEAFNSALPLGLERIDVLAITRLRDCQQGYAVWGNEWVHTSLDRAAMPNTRLSWAIDFLSTIVSELPTYCSYRARKVGRCKTGKSGAHSWKKMLIIWSDTRRGGALKETIRLGPVGRLVPPAPKKAFELTSADSLPVSWAFCLNASAVRQTWFWRGVKGEAYRRASVHSSCLQSKNRDSRRRARVATAGP